MGEGGRRGHLDRGLPRARGTSGKLALIEIDLGSDAIPVAIATPGDVAALAKLGCKRIAPRRELAATARVPASEQKLIALEDATPHEEFRYVIAGTARGDEIFGVTYHEPYLNYTFYSEVRGRLGFEKTDVTRKTGFASRDAAVATAERELATRVADGWTRVSRQRWFALHGAAKQ